MTSNTPIGYILLLAAAAYAAFRTYRILPLKKWFKVLLMVVYALGAAGYMLAVTNSLEWMPMNAATVTYIFGNTWLIFFLYSLMMFVLAEVLRLFGILPAKVLERSIAGSAVIFGFVIIIMTYGAINYRNIHREELSVNTVKVERPLKIVMVSDLHLGYHIRRAQLARWVDMINAENPDLVLVSGDIIDRSLRAVKEEGDAQEFRRIKAPVYACLGNHEYYAGVEESKAFYREAGINLLVDSAAIVCGITLIGRDDAFNEERDKIEPVIEKTDPRSYRILLKHRPDTLSEAFKAGVDMQLSGHLHGGQIWPATWLVRIENELGYGYKELYGTRFYVSSGLGIWGGRFRIGSRCEYLVLELKPAQPQRYSSNLTTVRIQSPIRSRKL